MVENQDFEALLARLERGSSRDSLWFLFLFDGNLRKHGSRASSFKLPWGKGGILKSSMTDAALFEFVLR
jgi:hypothetical protein